mgnify:CR=1 FL=1
MTKCALSASAQSRTCLINQYFKCQNRQNKPPVLSKQSKSILINTLTLLGAHYLKNRQAKHAEQSKIISRAIEYISEHLTEPITLDDISNALYTNKYYFAHLFKEETGVSPHSYILKKRLLLSKELIEQGLSITDVYVRCGFSDYTHFFRAFKKEFDLTPKQYFHLMKTI